MTQTGDRQRTCAGPGSGWSRPGATPLLALIAEQVPIGKSRSKPVIDQRWPFPDGEVALIVSIDRPLFAADFASIGAVVGEIERLVAGLTSGDANA